MKIEKRVNLYAFEVEYIDQREAKPRTVHRETVVLDGGRVSDFLWKLAVLDVAAAKAGKAVAQLLEGGVNHAQA